MSEHKSLSIEITSADLMTAGVVRSASGWGPDTSNLSVEGKVVEFVIKKDGEEMFGLIIRPDGSLVISGYNMFFRQELERHIRLTNERPWKDTNDTAQDSHNEAAANRGQ